jgi:hypothetical protein
MRQATILMLGGLAMLSVNFTSVFAQAEVVGSMTALQTNISGTNGRALSVGSKISMGDRLKSNKTGLGMIVFNDESSAKIGPNSQLTIDDFVYQPGRSRGKIAIKMKSGLVRFYGGQISKAGKMQITTPHIVLGVRGGILDTVVEKGMTRAILRAGRMFCSVNGQKRVVTKPGFACLSDGTSLRVQKALLEDLDLLDSQDRAAGDGVPGRLGRGLNARASCIAGSSDGSSRCKSENGSLPGIDGKPRRTRDPIIPLGSDGPVSVCLPSDPYYPYCL